MNHLPNYHLSDNKQDDGADDNPAREKEREAVKNNAGSPGSIADTSGMSGDLDGGGGIGGGRGEDTHLDKGDTGPTPDKESRKEDI